jgi:hypothetical protein
MMLTNTKYFRTRRKVLEDLDASIKTLLEREYSQQISIHLMLLLQLIHNFQRNKTNYRFLRNQSTCRPEYLVEIEFTAVVSENNLSTKDFILA